MGLAQLENSCAKDRICPEPGTTALFLDDYQPGKAGRCIIFLDFHFGAPFFCDRFTYLAVMSNINSIREFLSPLNIREIAGDDSYNANQIGAQINKYEQEFPDLDLADLVLVGCGEQRGRGIMGPPSFAPDVVRSHFYSLYCWHEGIRLADVGNIQQGASYNDTRAALKTVVAELVQHHKTVIILGGSHDLTLAQYGAYVQNKTVVEATLVDALIDLNLESPFANDNFLMEILTGEPNFIRHYNHLAFQSYLVHPGMLQTLDKLKFDCYRVGAVKEHIEEVEPAIRNSSLFSVDINALAHAYAPAGSLSPNGLNGEEACTLMQYAGMSSRVNTIGIYGYEPEKDKDDLTAKQISQMIWYVIDGRYKGQKEADFKNRDRFKEYLMMFSEMETTFLQSKVTGRWWMQVGGKKFVPCSYRDYLQAASDEIPERWFRANERDL